MKDLINKNKYAYKNIICFIFCLVGFAFFLDICEVRASQQIMAQQTTSGGNTGCAQTFLATSSNLSSISVYKSALVGATDYKMAVFFGSYDVAKTYQENVRGEGWAVILKGATATTTLQATTTGQWYNFDFPDFSVASGSTYFFSLLSWADHSISTTYNYGRCDFEIYNLYPYGQRVNIASTTQDITFKIYYETNYYETPVTPRTTPPDTTLLDWRSDINTVQNQLCIIGNTCNLWFSYNEMAINDWVHILNDVAGQQTPVYSLGSVQIKYSPLWQEKLLVPPETAEQRKDYCLYMVDAEFGDLLSCGIEIRWVSSSTFEDILGISEIITYENVCDSVATSTGGMDDARYFAECGLRKMALWAFSPSPEALTTFVNNYNLLKRAFPFNIFFDLTDTVKTAVNNTATSTSGSFGLPFVNASGDFYILPVISSSSLSNAIGATNANTFRTTLSYIIYLATAGAIFFILL